MVPENSSIEKIDWARKSKQAAEIDHAEPEQRRHKEDEDQQVMPADQQVREAARRALVRRGGESLHSSLSIG